MGDFELSLKERVAIVTGSGRGIGKDIAQTLARAGAKIVACARNKEEIEETVNDIKREGGPALAVPFDVRERRQVKSLMETAFDAFGRIDILVNNAGITRRRPLLEMGEEDWDDVLEVNLRGAFFCTQEAAKFMTPRRYGKIINISSMAGRGWADPDGANYAASKAGLIQFTKNCARALGSFGINVNCVAPGSIETSLIHVGRTSDEVTKYCADAKRSAVLNRLGTPRDISNVVLFLSSDFSSFITGQTIAVDGGRTDRM